MMKKTFLFLLMALFTIGFTSCSDDDDIYYITEKDLDGVYLGSLDVEAPFQGTDLGAKDIKQKIYFAKTGENLIRLQLKNFVFNQIPIGDLEVNDITVEKSGDKFLLNGTGKLTLIVGACDVKVTGTTDQAGNCTVAINVEVTGQGTGVDFTGLKVVVDFQGKRLEKDLSSEAVITDFNFNNENITNVVIKEKTIQFYIKESATEFKFTPTVTVSEGATVTPESGKEQDFSSTVKYTVVSEDGIVTNEYFVVKAGKITEINFDEWSVVNSTTFGSSESFENPVGMYGTSNPGIMSINDMMGTNLSEMYEYTVTPVQGRTGKAAQLKTIYTFMDLGGMDGNAVWGGMIPYVTSGTFFTGTFKTDMRNPLNSTKFGVPFVGKPEVFSGWYKYTPGTVYYDNRNNVVDGKEDECSIYAVLYEEMLDNNNNNIPLTGDYEDPEAYIGSSSRIIMKAALEDGKAKAEWTSFSVPFQLLAGKTYSAAKKYYLAVVCSSSFEGDYYKGAPGSTLVIDDFKIEAVLE